MSERSQYQYTPVTGPVWTEPVAAKLAWLPRGQQPARARPPHLLGWYCRPETEALYRPEGLQWLADGRYAGRALEFSRRDWTVLPELVAAPAFDPQRLEWMPQGRPWLTLPERRSVGDFAQPQFAALYRPERLEWQPEDSYAGRILPRSLNDQTVFQQPSIIAAFDPQRLEWVPQGRHWLARAERRVLGDFAQPIFAALYRPERLEWQSEDGYFGRPLARGHLDLTVLQPPIFAPQTMDWLPGGRHTPTPSERRFLGAFVQPAFEALYRPDRIEWALSGQRPQRTLAAIRTGAWVSDPVTPAVLIVSAAGKRIITVDLQGRTVIVDSDGRIITVDLAARTIQ